MARRSAVPSLPSEYGPAMTAFASRSARAVVARHAATGSVAMGHPPSVTGSSPCATWTSRIASRIASGSAVSARSGRGNGPRSVANIAAGC